MAIENLCQQWIGVDISPESVELVKMVAGDTLPCITAAKLSTTTCPASHRSVGR